MIKSFADKRTAILFQGRTGKGIAPELARRVRTKLIAVHGAEALDELRAVPGNRLERLSGDRAGTWSIRVNDQWRVCFVWRDGDAYGVELVDYH
jgi:proteic killer suppression protein